jgi:hypothetical protein
MKTKNNVQKAITKLLAVSISLVLISITVQAQEFWKSVLINNAFHQIAMTDESNVVLPPIHSHADLVSFYEEESDKELLLEDWMVNQNYFLGKLTSEIEQESSLELEPRKMNENLFTGVEAWFTTEKEDTLELEYWMIDTDYFGVRTVEVKIEKDAKLQLEEWMINSKIWNIR